MVIIIYKLPVRSFTFLQYLSVTELPNLNGTLYILAEGSTINQNGRHRPLDLLRC
jgi:hypothetical protein